MKALGMLDRNVVMVFVKHKLSFQGPQHFTGVKGRRLQKGQPKITQVEVVFDPNPFGSH